MQRSMAIIWALATSLCGCATPYGSSGLTGGYFEKAVNDRLTYVVFSGNGFISSTKVQAYALYRCAELAHAARKPYFVLYDSLIAAARDRPAPTATVGSLGGKPSAHAFITLLDEHREAAHETDKVLAELKPMIEGESSTGARKP